MTESAQTIEQEELFFVDRFWEQYLGKRIVTDPVTALVELVANAWDAGAKEVKIEWSGDVSMRGSRLFPQSVVECLN